MRHKDPELMKKIYEYAEDYYFSEGYSPSTSEIANAMGIARTTAYNYLVAMDKLGMVDYDGKLIATEKIRKTGTVNHGVKSTTMLFHAVNWKLSNPLSVNM